MDWISSKLVKNADSNNLNLTCREEKPTIYEKGTSKHQKQIPKSIHNNGLNDKVQQISLLLLQNTDLVDLDITVEKKKNPKLYEKKCQSIGTKSPKSMHNPN